MTEDMDGKVALVTGGASGIGRATALRFASDKASVVIADVDVEGGEETVRAIEANGAEARFVRADVSQRSDVEGLINKVIEACGRLDYAFNNAGISSPRRALLADQTEEAWDLVVDINLKGVWLCMKYEILQMLEQGSGAIVNTSSIYGLVASSMGPVYTAAKHGVIGLTKSAALAYAQKGIRVNAVCPGGTRSPMVERLIAKDPAWEEGFVAEHPIGQMGTPEEIAEAVVWLCSDKASFVTGHALAVDGGYTTG